jgi:anti-sigma regulatory factor (Ser/Thr protein kinase)
LAPPLEPSEPAPLALLFSSDAGHLARARAAAHRWLQSVAVSEEVAAEIVLAMNEAVANAIEHAYRTGEGPYTVSVDAYVKDGELTVTVADRGVWRRRRAGSDGGRGLGLIEALTDDSHVQRAPGGTEVRLRRRLN